MAGFNEKIKAEYYFFSLENLCKITEYDELSKNYLK